MTRYLHLKLEEFFFEIKKKIGNFGAKNSLQNRLFNYVCHWEPLDSMPQRISDLLMQKEQHKVVKLSFLVDLKWKIVKTKNYRID
jgi:hypothetical protein